MTQLIVVDEKNITQVCEYLQKEPLLRTCHGILLFCNNSNNITTCIITCVITERKRIYYFPVLQNNCVCYRLFIMLIDILYLFALKPRSLDRYTQDKQRSIRFALLFFLAFLLSLIKPIEPQSLLLPNVFYYVVTLYLGAFLIAWSYRFWFFSAEKEYRFTSIIDILSVSLLVNFLIIPLHFLSIEYGNFFVFLQIIIFTYSLILFSLSLTALFEIKILISFISVVVSVFLFISVMLLVHVIFITINLFPVPILQLMPR